MAADLVESPTIRHTFVHDLESFFWVLIWIVLTRVKTSWNVGVRSAFIRGTMSPKIYLNSGGREKKRFLTSQTDLDKDHFSVPGNDHLGPLLDGLRDLVAIRHTLPPSDSPKPFYAHTIAGGEQASSQTMEAYEDRKAHLDNHSTMTKIFDTALEAETWPPNDKAEKLPILRSNSVVGASASGSKRSRSIAEENDVFNEPSSSKRQG
jgi:hypothetical protein